MLYQIKKKINFTKNKKSKKKIFFQQSFNFCNHTKIKKIQKKSEFLKEFQRVLTMSLTLLTLFDLAAI